MVFRLGVLRFRVKELKEEEFPYDNSKSSLYENSPNRFESDEQFNIFPNTTSSCRICFGSHQTKKNPLISPCHCSGTMKCVHLRCLQKWIINKVKRKYKNSAFSIFYWKNLVCELCKCPLEYHVNTEKHKNYSIIDIPKPNSKYLVLEILNLENNDVKGLHLITFLDKKQLTIGRGQEVDIQMKDASISRVHASLLFENEHFYLKDENSKFGTLVLQEKELQLNSLHPACGIQIGRSIFTIQKSVNKCMTLDQPLILQHPYSKQSSLEDKKPSQLCLGNNTLIIHSIHEIVDEVIQEPIHLQQQEDKEEEDESHNPYVFDEAPGLSLNSFTTQQLRKTQFPSFESSKFKMVEANNQSIYQLKCEEKMIYMTSTELQKQISSNSQQY